MGLYPKKKEEESRSTLHANEWTTQTPPLLSVSPSLNSTPVTTTTTTTTRRPCPVPHIESLIAMVNRGLRRFNIFTPATRLVWLTLLLIYNVSFSIYYLVIGDWVNLVSSYSDFCVILYEIWREWLLTRPGQAGRGPGGNGHGGGGPGGDGNGGDRRDGDSPPSSSSSSSSTDGDSNFRPQLNSTPVVPDPIPRLRRSQRIRDLSTIFEANESHGPIVPQPGGSNQVKLKNCWGSISVCYRSTN